MIRKTALAFVVATFALLSAGCNDDGTTTPATSSHTTTPTSKSVTAPVPNSTGSADNGGAVMQDPRGGSSTVPCEGTICTNPNHGAGNDPAENGGAVMQDPRGGNSTVPCEGTICTNPNHGAGE